MLLNIKQIECIIINYLGGIPDKKNKHFVFRRIKDETILVPIKDNVGDMGSIYNLNEVGAFVWEHLDGKNRLIDIKNMISEDFEVSPKEAKEDLCEFVGQLREIDAIHEAQGA